MASGGLSPDFPDELAALTAINWSAPWLQQWATWGMVVAHEALALQGQCAHPVAEALNHACERFGLALPVRFVGQNALPQGMAYEAFIRNERRVPTRNNLHDFFNGLAWLHSPRIKTRLNLLQSQAIAQDGVQQSRGPVRDAITVLDENGAILEAPPALWQALEERDWQRLFVRERSLWAQARLWPLGHALLEKLLNPRKPMVTHVLHCRAVVCRDLASWAEVDAQLEDVLNAELLARKPFLPMPVLGVPGWWPDNESPSFYADASVFRAKRTT